MIQELSHSPHSCLLSVVFSALSAVLFKLNDTNVKLKSLTDLAYLVTSVEKKYVTVASVTMFVIYN